MTVKYEVKFDISVSVESGGLEFLRPQFWQSFKPFRNLKKRTQKSYTEPVWDYFENMHVFRPKIVILLDIWLKSDKCKDLQSFTKYLRLTQVFI